MITADSLLGLIAPHTCISCKAEGSVLCIECIDTYFQPPEPRCMGCMKLSKEAKVCAACRRWLHVDRIHYAGTYEGLLEALIKSCKFDYKRQATVAMADILSRTLDMKQFGDYVLCPVPTALSRIRERGFDHTKRIAHQLAGNSGLQVHAALARKSNVRQLGANRAQRIKQMNTEFYIRKHVKDAHILLVDDVMTSGATLSAAAMVLKQAGANKVSAVIVARQI